MRRVDSLIWAMTTQAMDAGKSGFEVFGEPTAATEPSEGDLFAEIGGDTMAKHEKIQPGPSLFAIRRPLDASRYDAAATADRHLTKKPAPVIETAEGEVSGERYVSDFANAITGASFLGAQAAA